MFRNNRNNQKTNRNSSKFVQISTILIPLKKVFFFFGCFDTGPKHRNKPGEKFVGFAKKQTEKQPKQIEFRFEPRKKSNCFEDPLMENVCWRFFRFVSTKFCLFRLFRYRSETPKQTETNWKKSLWVSRNKPKNNRNRLSFGLFRFEDTLILSGINHSLFLNCFDAYLFI